MKIEIQNKYKIGDIIQVYEEEYINFEEIICPLCKGNYQVNNPEYDDDYYDCNEQEYLTCSCCNKGKIRIKKEKGKVLKDERYRVENIYIKIDKNNKATYDYGVYSSPKLNNRSYVYCSKRVSEDYMVISDIKTN